MIDSHIGVAFFGEKFRPDFLAIVTDAIVKPTLWTVASRLIFCVAHSLRIYLDVLVVRTLKISQPTDGGMPPTYDSMH